MYSAKQTYSTPRFLGAKDTPSSQEHKTPYPNSHTLRCLKLSLSPKRIRPISPTHFSQKVETLQAWEANKYLKREKLREELENAEKEVTPFHPRLAPNTLRIMKEQDQREGIQTAQSHVSLSLKDSVARALGQLHPDTKTHFNKNAFVTVSLPGSRHGSPGPQQVAIRNEQWLQTRNQKIRSRKQALPSGATFSPRVNVPAKPRQKELIPSSSNQSTKATVRAEVPESKTESLRSLSPYHQSVSYKAGLDLTSFMQRAQPLVPMKDLGLKSN